VSAYDSPTTYDSANLYNDVSGNPTPGSQGLRGRYLVQLRDSSLNVVGAVDSWTYLDVVTRFNGVGTWVLTLPTYVLPLIGQGGGVIIERDGARLISGPFDTPRYLRNEEWPNGALVLAGTSEEGYLDDRVTFADPAHSAATQTLTVDSRSGTAETLLRAYVNEQAAPGALAARRVAGLSLGAAVGLGSTINVATGMTETAGTAMFAAMWGANGVAGHPSSTDLLPVGDSSGAWVKVTASTRGVHVNGNWGRLTTTSQVDIPVNSSSNARIDRVVVRRDASANTLTLTRIAGTAATTPVAPALTAEDTPIALIAVPAGYLVGGNPVQSVSPGMVTDDRRFRPLGVIPCGPTTLPTSPFPGQMAYDTTNQILYMWDGSAWDYISRDSGWLTATAFVGWNRYLGGGGYPTFMQVRVLNKAVTIRGMVTCVDDTVATSSMVLLPSGTFPPFTHRFTNVSNGIAVDMRITTTGVITYLSGGGITTGRDYPIDTSYLLD
jgi:hypothetical protein